MRFFSTVAAFGLIALAAAQTTTNATEPASSTAQSAPATTSDTAQSRCLKACASTDICCQAKCVGVPCPNDLAVNQTTECAGQCVQGNGTEEETASYAACQSRCISSLFFPLSATATGAGATGTGAGSAEATTTGASGTGIGGPSGSGSATGSGAAASATDGGSSDNGAMRTKVAGAGLLGLVLAGLAL